MTIVYVNVCRARDAAVLCEATNADLRSTNVAQVTTQLLEHLRDHPTLIKDGECRTFIQKDQAETDFFSSFYEACSSAMGDVENLHADHFFHLFLKDEVFYVCLGDDPDMRDQKVNFHFLQQIQKEFTKLFQFRRINTAHAYSLDNTFAPSLRSAIHYHNVHHKELANDVKVQKIQSKIDSLQTIMGRNIRLVLDNQQKMEKLLVTSEEMRQDARVFRRKSQHALLLAKKKNIFMVVAIVISVVVVIYLAVLGICGSGLRYCRAAASGKNSGSNYDGGQPYTNNNGGNSNNNGGNYNNNNNNRNNNNGNDDGNANGNARNDDHQQANAGDDAGGGGGRNLLLHLVDPTEYN